MAITLLVIVTVTSLFIGVIDLDIRQVLSDPEVLWLMSVSRLPRTLAVLLTGTSLAIAGQVMQVLVQNRFVEPATAGSGQSAVLGIVLVTVFFPASSIAVKMLAASIAALVGTSVFLLMIRRLPLQETYLVPLVGIVYGGVIGAIATWVALQSDLLQLLDIWMTGEFSGMIGGRYGLLWIAGLLAVFTYWLADSFTIASLGSDHSRNLGINYDRVMAMGLLVVSVVTAVTVVTVGIIPFVGLVVPNIVSRLRGDYLRYSLPLVAWMGAMLTLLSDIAGRLVIAPYEIPAGTIFGVVGAAITLWLLYSKVPTRQA